jgi:anionic cell wall polymer biosynthesis LytR-Cps2A-Psr (LCP) family protein
VDLPEDLRADFGAQAPLNQIYRQAIEQALASQEDPVRHATGVIAQVIVDVFEFVPHKYVNLSGESFIDMVDEMGGLTINLESAVDGTAQNFGFFPAGENQLDGQRTLDFVRILTAEEGTIQDYTGRFQRQDLAIQAARDVLGKPENLAKLPALLEKADDFVVTDLDATQITALACIMEKVWPQTDLQQVGEEQVTIDAEGRMIPDVQAIKDMIAAMYEPAP